MGVSSSAGFILGVCVLSGTLLSSTLLCGARAAAPDTSSTPDATGAPVFQPVPLFDPAMLSVQTLPNGVRGIVRETRGSGLVCVQVWVRAGSRYESDVQSGASKLLAEIGLRSSRNYPRRADASGNVSGGPRESLENLGGDVKNLTARDATFFSAVVAAPFLPQALRALSDAALRPTISESAIIEARLDVSGEQRRRENDALDALQDAAFRLAFTKHPYKKPAGGSSSSLEALSAGMVQQFHQARFVGKNISVVVTGDAPRATAQKLITQFFSDASATALPESSVAPEVALPEFKTVSRRFATGNRIVTLGFRAPGITQPTDVIATDILLAHWKEGSGARLRPLLLGPDKDEAADRNAGAETPALGFDVDFLTQRDPGLLVVTIVSNPQTRGGSAVGVLMDEIERVQTHELSAEELSRAKAALIRQYMEQSDTVSGQAGALGFYDMIADYRFAVNYLDLIGRVTADDVKRVANKYLSRTSYVQVIAEPQTRPKAEPDDTSGSANAVTASVRVRVP